MQQHSQRILALLLTVCMLLVCLPAGILAEEATVTEIKQQQLSLGDDLDMHFYASVTPAHQADAVISVSVDGQSPVSHPISDLEQINGLYDLSVSLAAAQITDPIAISIVSGGEAVFSKTYSVLDYLKVILEGNYTSATKALVKELLGYGAQAQLYFQHHIDTLANAGYETEPGATIPAEAPAISTTGSVTGLSFYGASLLFESKIGIRFYFSAPNGVEGISFETSDNVFSAQQKNGLYYIDIDGILPQYMDNATVLTAKAGNEALTVSYSPMNYIVRMYNKAGASDSFKSFLLAANSYFAAAKDFAGAEQTRTGSLSFELRGGVADYIQVNTNLPADTPLDSFNTNQNGCNIDESTNKYQNVGWIGMDNASGTIVLTFHFNSNFEAGQTYVLPKGAIFGFKDESKYTLDKDYTFIFDGKSWSEPVVVVCSATLTAGFTTANLVQFVNFYDFGVPAENTPLNFTGTVKLDGEVVENPEFIGYPGNTTICLNNLQHQGKVLTIEAGSTLSYGTKAIEISETFHMIWGGNDNGWSVPVVVVCSATLTAGFTTANLVQFVNFYDFGVPAENTPLNFTGTVKLDGEVVENPEFIGYPGNTTICLNNLQHQGKVLTIEAGSTISYGTKAIEISETFHMIWGGEGAGWAEPVVVVGSAVLTAGYTAETLVQFTNFYDFGVPADNTALNFTGTVKLDGEVVENPEFIGYANNTVICLNNISHKGKVLTIEAGSTLSYGTEAIEIKETFHMIWFSNEIGWKDPNKTDTKLTFELRGGVANYIQVNTNLPADTPCANFLTGKNGSSIDESANLYHQASWIAMANVDGTIVLTFTFYNISFNAGETYVLPKGAIFGFTDGKFYALDKDYTFTFDGASWSMETHETAIALSYRYGEKTLIQFNTNLPDSVPLADFTSDANGCAFIQSGNQTVGWIHMLKAEDGKIALTFNFNSAFTFGQSYTLSAGTIFCFTDGSKYELRESITLYWNPEINNWTTSVPTPSDKLDASYYTGGELISFADRPVDSRDPAAIEKYKALGFNTSLLTEDFTQGEHYKLTMTTGNAAEDALSFEFRYGTARVIQVNTNLPADTPCANFLSDANGCKITQNGKNVGWIGMTKADDGYITLAFNFNEGDEFQAGGSYTLKAGSVFGFTDGSKYTLNGDYTFTFDGTSWSMENSVLTFELTQVTAGNIIQLKTNIPTNLSYGDFTIDQATDKGHKILLEQSEGSEIVGWYHFNPTPVTAEDGTSTHYIFFNLNFNGINKPGAVYTLKAGTTLKAADKTYVTDRDYTFSLSNPYLTSLENLDKAGLSVWIRNHKNTAEYFTTELTNELLLYKDAIDGFFMGDEFFETKALLDKTGQNAYRSDFESMDKVLTWFNDNFADTYFHMNHVPISDYDHYTTDGETAATSASVESYQRFLETYKELFVDQLTGNAGASISYNNYPFTHAQGNYGGFIGIGTKFHSGIAEDYLLNALIAANVAGNENDLGICIQSAKMTDSVLGAERDITIAEEISFQIYSGLAFGADLFEYYAYTSSEAMNVTGIIYEDGTDRIYQQVLDGNKALCFAEVSNSFDWNGIITVAGSVENYNSTAFSKVKDMILADTGALSTASATYDAIIGCFSHKNGQNGYMVVNFNDPVAVKENNSVTVSFDGCTRARVYTLVDGEMTSEIVNLTNGSYTATVAPGSDFFIIPA